MTKDSIKNEIAQINNRIQELGCEGALYGYVEQLFGEIAEIERRLRYIRAVLFMNVSEQDVLTRAAWSLRIGERSLAWKRHQLAAAEPQLSQINDLLLRQTRLEIELRELDMQSAPAPIKVESLNLSSYKLNRDGRRMYAPVESAPSLYL